MPSNDANKANLAEFGLMYEEAVEVIRECLCGFTHRSDPDKVARAILARLANQNPPILLSRE